METTPGKRVQLLREAKGYKSLTGFAEYTGLKIGTLSALEGDKSAPSFETVSRLMQSFPDLNPDWLLLGAGAMLRDGKALTALPAPVASHASYGAGLTSGPATVAEAENVLLRQQLADKDKQIADKEKLIDKLWALNGLPEKLGKLLSSSDAALERLLTRFARRGRVAELQLG